MHPRVLIPYLLVLAGTPLWLAACSPAKPLAVAVHPRIGYESLYLARDFGWLPAGVTLHAGHAAGDSLAALKAGTVDAAALTLEEVLLPRPDGLDALHSAAYLPATDAMNP